MLKSYSRAGLMIRCFSQHVMDYIVFVCVLFLATVLWDWGFFVCFYFFWGMILFCFIGFVKFRLVLGLCLLFEKQLKVGWIGGEEGSERI